MRRGRVTRRVAALAVLALVASGCGARWTDAQREELSSRSASGSRSTPSGEPVAAGTVAESGTVDPSLGPASNGPGTGAAGATSGAGPASSGGGALPCAAPTTAPGVTDQQITMGSLSSSTGPVPGLGASSAAAVRAYVAYRNATGGVCGRRVALREADDGSDAARYRTILRELDPRVIAFAGGLTLADDGSAEIIRAGKIPMLASRSADGVQGQPTVFDLNPPYADLSKPIGRYDHIYGQGARTAVLAYLAVDASRLEAETQRSLMEASGLQVVDVIELAISTLSFDSPARRIANSGADYVLFIGDAGSNGSMARAIEGTRNDVLQDYFTFAYGESFIALAGAAAAEGATTWNRTLPNEEAGSNEEVAAFVSWMNRTSPGTPQDAFAAESWVAVKALFDSLEALPGPITRDALVAQLRATDTYDAGGMMGPIKLGQQQNLGCFVGLQVQGGVWKRMAPASGFVCGR